MRSELKVLFHPKPVMLEPVFSRAVPAPVGWSLPSRAESRVLLTFHGTAAIYQAILSLGLAEGENVLIPSYNCGHELEPVLRAGAVAKYYRVDEDLQADFVDIAAAIDSGTRAVLVTHYFGFPQRMDPIRQLCDRHGLALIEDCAHALFSSEGATPIGMAGDFAIYSLRKTLPLPHGGALVCHDRRWTLPGSLTSPPRLSTSLKWLERYQKSLLLARSGTSWPVSRLAFLATRLVVDLGHTVSMLSRGIGVMQWDPDDESLHFPQAVLEWGVAASVERALHCMQAQAIVAARRKNFMRLLSASDRFIGCRPLIGDLPTGVCPLNFPVIADDPPALLDRLRQGAVSAVQWWGLFHPAVPWQRFPEADYLKRNVVVLPIHQDLQDVHMDRIVALLAPG